MLEMNQIYLVNHQRKGTFMLRIISESDDGVWVTGYIVSGKAKSILRYNKYEAGEKITVRKSFCKFTKQ